MAARPGPPAKLGRSRSGAIPRSPRMGKRINPTSDATSLCWRCCRATVTTICWRSTLAHPWPAGHGWATARIGNPAGAVHLQLSATVRESPGTVTVGGFTSNPIDEPA